MRLAGEHWPTRLMASFPSGPRTTSIDAVAQANGLELHSVYRDLRPHLETSISKNSSMAKDFRVAMTQSLRV